MTAADSGYLPTPKKVPFPIDLALKIVRRVAALADEFEDRALNQMTLDAEKALAMGVFPSEVIREMEL